MSEDRDVTEMLRERAAEVRGSAADAVEGLNQRTVATLDGVVATADGTRESLQSRIDSLSAEAIQLLTTVADIAKDHIQENDIDIEISDNRIHIEGDEVGLRKIETELRNTDILQNRDVEITYDREDGIDINLGEQDAGDTS
jgi:hypothetical protein